MAFPLDPLEVLQHLNNLGYTNISAEQLKEFMTGMLRNNHIKRRHRLCAAPVFGTQFNTYRFVFQFKI